MKDSAYRVTIEELNTNVHPPIVLNSFTEFVDNCKSEVEPLCFYICAKTYDNPMLFVFNLIKELKETHLLGGSIRHYENDYWIKTIKLLKEIFKKERAGE